MNKISSSHIFTKFSSRLKVIAIERGVLGILFLPFDFLLNRILEIFFSKKKILSINAVDVYQRYSTIAQLITSDDKKILEIGGANTALYEFLTHKYTLTIIDINKNYNPPSNLHYILKNTDKLNYVDNQFDCVLSVAMLEHLSLEQRQKFINEWKRVGKKVLVYVPFGKDGEKYDRQLLKLRKFIGMYDKWTEEHIKYGLPRLDELRIYFPNAKITFLQNANVWLITTFLSSLPIIGRIFPGLVYIFLKNKDNNEPFIGCIVEWKNPHN